MLFFINVNIHQALYLFLESFPHLMDLCLVALFHCAHLQCVTLLYAVQLALELLTSTPLLFYLLPQCSHCYLQLSQLSFIYSRFQRGLWCHLYLLQGFHISPCFLQSGFSVIQVTLKGFISPRQLLYLLCFLLQPGQLCVFCFHSLLKLLFYLF